LSGRRRRLATSKGAYDACGEGSGATRREGPNRQAEDADHGAAFPAPVLHGARLRDEGRLVGAVRIAVTQPPLGPPTEARENAVLRVCRRTAREHRPARSYAQAARIPTAVTDGLARSTLAEIHTMRAPLLRWRREVLAYFRTALD
jgi:hypothetical protein